MIRLHTVLASSAIVALLGCGEDPVPARELGAALARDPGFSSSPYNAFACTDCHATAEHDARILPGASLLGATQRPSYWNGYETSLEDAVNVCLVFFMKGDRLDPESERAKALYEYLASLEGGSTAATPFTIVRTTTVAPTRRDAERGAIVHTLACASCHGAAQTGEGGRAKAAPPILPEQAVAEARAGFPNFEPAAVFNEKVRHGQFFGVGGNMPPFSLEVLSDEDLGALLAFYGI